MPTLVCLYSYTPRYPMGDDARCPLNREPTLSFVNQPVEAFSAFPS